MSVQVIRRYENVIIVLMFVLYKKTHAQIDQI